MAVSAFTVPVTLTVSGGSVPASAPGPANVAPKPAIPIAQPAHPAAPAASVSPPAADTAGRRWPSLIWLPTVLLAVTVFGAALRDYMTPEHRADAIQEEAVDSTPRIEIRFHDEPKNDELEKLWLADRHPTMRFGVVLLRKGQPVGQGANLTRLTFDPVGAPQQYLSAA